MEAIYYKKIIDLSIHNNRLQRRPIFPFLSKVSLEDTPTRRINKGEVKAKCCALERNRITTRLQEPALQFQSIKSRREIERKWEEKVGDTLESSFLSSDTTIYCIYTFASSHCSTHRRLRGGSSSSESEG